MFLFPLLGRGISSNRLVLKLYKCRKYDPSYDPLVLYGACTVDNDIKDEPPNEANLTVSANFQLIHISKVDEIESILTAHLKFSMFWIDDRIKTNFAHKTKPNSSYDALKLNIKKYLRNEKTGVAGSQGVPLWLPDFNFENQLMQEPVTEEFVLTDLKILSDNPFPPTFGISKK